MDIFFFNWIGKKDEKKINGKNNDSGDKEIKLRKCFTTKKNKDKYFFQINGKK